MLSRLFDRLTSDRWADFAAAVVISGYLSYVLVFKTTPWSPVHFSWLPVIVLGVVAAIGLIMRTGWRRWAVVGFLSALLLSWLVMKVLYGWKLSDAFIFPFIGWWIWQSCTTDAYANNTPAKEDDSEDESSEERRPLTSLVLLQKELPHLEPVVLARLASQAWGVPVSGSDLDEDEGDAPEEDSTEKGAYVIGQAPVF